GRRRDHGRRRRRARDVARSDQGVPARRNPSARGQGRRRPVEPDRLRRERADDPDTAGRRVVRLRRRRPAPCERALREGVRESGCHSARERGKPRAADGALLCHRRRRSGGSRPTPHQGGRLRAVEGRRPLRRGSNRRPRRRAPGADLRSRRGPGHRNRRSEDMSATDTATLPDYAPLPETALGPALNEQGYYVGRVERNLYYVTDGTYMCAFLTTSDGVVVLDAPPTLGNNIQRAIDEIAAANGVSNKVEHLVYSHHHSDHVGAASLFDKNVTRIGHEETRTLLLRDNDPARPPNEETFQDKRTLEIGGERIDLSWEGPNHSPDNILIHLPGHDTMMLVDICNPGWVPIYRSNLSEDIPGYIEAPANALAYEWTHFIGGHMGRLGTRDDLALHQQYMADLADSSRHAIDTVDPTPYFVKYGENFWAALKGYLDECAATTAAPVIEKYTGVLAAADVFTEDVAFEVMQSIRLDFGYGAQVHP